MWLHGNYHESNKSNQIINVMKVEEAILYLLAERNGGMKAEQLADEISRRHLSVRKDGQPVSVKQIWYAVLTHKETFCLAEGRIMLMI